MTNAVSVPAVSDPNPTLHDALTVLLGFVSSHADRGSDVAKGMVDFANAALAAEDERASSPVFVVVEMESGLINSVKSSHPVGVYIMDGDTEGGDKSNIMEIDGQDFYLSNQSVSADEAKGANDAAFNATVEQIELHLKTPSAKPKP